MPPRSRFGSVNNADHAAIFAANMRGMAEAISKTDNSNPEDLHAQFMALVYEQFEILVSSIYHQGTLVQIPFVANQTPRIIRPSEARNYVFIQNQSAGAQMILSIGQDPIDPTASPVNGLIIGANLGYYEPVVVPSQDLWVAATVDDTPGLMIISLPSWQASTPNI